MYNCKIDSNYFIYMHFTAKLSVILRKRPDTIERVELNSNIHVEQDDTTNSADELAMEQNEAYAAAPQNRELEFEHNEAQSSTDTGIKMERNTAYQTVSCPQKENDYETITSS